MAQAIDRSDIQGLVASGYKRFPHARFVFLQVLDDPRKAQDWITRLVDRVTTAVHPDDKSKPCLNLAFSWQGLKALKLPDKLLDDFPHEFVAGMNRREAGEILGDTVKSSQLNWEYGGSNSMPLHVLALLYAKTAAELEELYKTTCGPDMLKGGLEVVVEQNSEQDNLYEPFGFRDGISQPPVRGLLGQSKKPVEEEVETGEFVLGYENELGQIARIPSVPDSEDQHDHLGRHPLQQDNLKAFGLNGTYLVFRKLSQNVECFWKYVRQQAENSDLSAELIAAKMMGRWRNGTPLVLSPNVQLESQELIFNHFMFGETDEEGLKCPVGAHIRRANPRDSLPMGRSKSLRVSRRHRIIRRGRKYREAGQQDQGIFFIALNANLRRQFEFVQQTWLNDAAFNGLDNEKDPIVGDNAGEGDFTIQGGAPSRLCGLPRFVIVRGGGYFFLPGIRALRFLSSHAGEKNPR
jgi:Dyp-type peroxidase family